MFMDIESSSNWQAVEQISKGWSSDKKYTNKTKSRELLLPRIVDIEQYDPKKKG